MPLTKNKKQKPITTLKKILNAGQGLTPEFLANTKVFFHYEVYQPPKPPPCPLNNGEDEDRPVLFPDDRSLYKLIDSTKKQWPHGYGKPLELVFGRKFQLPLFEECLKTMLINEVSQFDVYDPTELSAFPVLSKKLRDIARSELDPNFHIHDVHHCAASGPIRLGYSELDELLGNPTPLRIVFHLLSVLKPDQYEQDSWQLNDQQKLSNLENLRTEGKKLFSEGAFESAMDKYQEALSLIDKLLLKEKPNDPEWVDLDQKNIPFYLNLSQCFLNIGKFYDAAECASEALKRDPCNEKALFRRIKARIGTWDMDLAEADLTALKVIPRMLYG